MTEKTQTRVDIAQEVEFDAGKSLEKLLSFNNAYEHNSEEVRELLVHLDKLEKINTHGVPLFYLASLAKNTDLIDDYIATGIDINKTQINKENVLAWALRNKCTLEMAYHLITKKVDLDSGALNAAYETKNVKAIEMLIDNGANPFVNRNKDTVFVSMLREYTTEEMLEKNNIVMKMLASEHNDKMTTLDGFIMYLHTNCEDDAEGAFLASINNIHSLSRYEQTTLIDLGVEHYPYHLAQMYQELGPSFGLKRHIYACAAKKGVNMVKRLYAIEDTPAYMAKAFIESVETNNISVLEFIMSKRYKAIEEPIPFKKTPPPLFAIVSSPNIHPETCSLVLDNLTVSQRNTLSPTGESLLHHARLNGADHLIQLLLDKGVKANIKNYDRKTYLEV